MKKIKFMLRLLFVMLFLQISNAQSQSNTQEDLLGTWIFDYEASYDSLQGIRKTHFDQAPSNVIESIETKYKDKKITFSPDGSYTQVSKTGVTLEGMWEVFEELEEGEIMERFIIVQTPEGGKYLYRVKDLSSTSLTLAVRPLGGQVHDIFPTWVLVKQ